MVAWVRDNSIHIRPFALKGWLMFLLLSLPVECAFVGVRLKPSSSSCLFSYIEYAFHRRAKGPPPHASSLLLPIWYAG